jgi:hypothetical protein
LVTSFLGIKERTLISPAVVHADIAGSKTFWGKSTTTERFAVLFALLRESVPSLLYFVVMMDALDGLLEPHRNDEADDDGGDMDEKVSPRVNGFIGWMYVEHARVLRQHWGDEQDQSSIAAASSGISDGFLIGGGQRGRLCIDRDLDDFAGELVVSLFVVVRYRCFTVHAHVCALVAGEGEGLCLWDVGLGYLLAIEDRFCLLSLV